MGIKCPKCQHENPDDTLFCGKCATRLPSPEGIEVTETLETPKEELTRGTTLANRYEIIEELGKGGMGRVYRVEDTKLKQEIALKLIKPEIAKDKKTIERFRNELKLARNIRHKNVCGMFDLGEEKGTHYITMEYVRGEDLRSLIKRIGQLPIGKSISIAKQLCEGLSEAHRLGVVHRDLKSNNIMIDKEGNVRIMDFGIARSLEARGITGAGMMIGTPEYMSPEQVEGREVDQRSDIYSLGVILYEMVTGRVPFEGDTPLSIAMKHKSEVPPDPKELNAQIPEDLSLVILKCMEKSREKRFQRAEEFLSELSEIEQGIPIPEREVPKRRILTSKKISVRFGLKRLLIPALVIIALAIISVAIWQLLPLKKAVSLPPGKPSIAVLPFRDFSPQKDQEYFCYGMTDAIIEKLSQLGELKVSSLTSVMRYKDTDKDIKNIGQELGVGSILEGSIQKEKDNMLVRAQLVNIEDNFHIWSDHYDRKLESVFEVQNDIAEKIANALVTKLSPEEKAKLQKKPTENLEAYSLYLKARWFWNKWTDEAMKKGIEYFKQAIEKDPSCALAYAGLAEAYNTLSFYSLIPPEDIYPKAKELVFKALAIDDTLSEAHTVLAFIRAYYDWDFEGAEREFKKAIKLNPDYLTAHHLYAYYLVLGARFDEAISEIKRALEIEPLNLITNRTLGDIFYHARQYDKAIEPLQKTIEMDPYFTFVHGYLGLVYLQKSMYDEALTELQKEVNLRRGTEPIAKAWMGIVYIEMGNRERGKEILDDLLERSKKEYIPPSVLSWLYFALGENDIGFKCLDRAYKERDIWLPQIKTDHAFDNIRSDPRYKALIKKMGLDK